MRKDEHRHLYYHLLKSKQIIFPSACKEESQKDQDARMKTNTSITTSSSLMTPPTKVRVRQVIFHNILHLAGRRIKPIRLSKMFHVELCEIQNDWFHVEHSPLIKSLDRWLIGSPLGQPCAFSVKGNLL
jgi:hypothetical protein